MASRWRREDYDKVKHDKCFSEWKVLVGPSDWQASGREGGERFRSRSLPGAQVGSGVYELGVTLPAWKTVDHYSESSSLKSEDIVVVYVGHAEHMRNRLQRYGQAGAHLEGPRSPNSPTANKLPKLNFVHVEDLTQSSNGEEHLCKYSQIASEDRPSRMDGRRGGRVDMQVSILQSRIAVAETVSPEVRGRGSPRGPRLFSEVFALGCSIAYRWASTRKKEVAEYAVQDLTEVFDYAWNRGGNSHLRSQDILGKIVLGKRAPDTSCCTRTSSRWNGFPFTRKPVVGIRIAAHKPTGTRMRWLGESVDSGPRRFFTLLRKSPHLMIIGGKSAKHSEFTKINIPVDRCGELLETGLVCNGLPQKGRKRCPTHMHMDSKRPSRRNSSQVASQDSRSGSLASDSPEPASFDSQKGLSLPKVPSSCFPFRLPKKPTQKEPKRKGSVSFSTWLTRSVEIKNKGIEWLLAMEEIKGRSYNHDDCSTSLILKPEIFSPANVNLSEELPPGWVPRISLSNLNQGMEPVCKQEVPENVEDIRYYPKVDRGMPYSIVPKGSPVRWPPAPKFSDTYATRYVAPRYFQG